MILRAEECPDCVRLAGGIKRGRLEHESSKLFWHGQLARLRMTFLIVSPLICFAHFIGDAASL
jgi:hypothetical protein